MGKREKILEIALKLFMEKGFNKTSIDEITKLADISKGSFYTYFKSKEELLESIIEELLEVVEEKFFKIISLKKKPIDFIEAFLKLNVSLSKKFSSSVLTIMRDVSFAPTKVREEMRRKLRDRINEKLGEFISLLKGKIEKEDIILLWGIVMSLWASVIFGEEMPSLKRLSEKIWYGIGGGNYETVL